VPADRSPTGMPSWNATEDDVVRLLALRRREVRDGSGLFFMEGVRFLAEAADHRAGLESLVVAPDLLESPVGRAVANRLRRAGTPCMVVTARDFHRLSMSESPQGIAAVGRQRWQSLLATRPGMGLCWLLLDHIRSPGNLGTMLRTSEAVGGTGAILLGGAADPYDPASVRASMGALFGQKLVRTTEQEFNAWRRRHGVVTVGTSPHAHRSYCTVAYRGPVALYMGSERGGIAPGRQGMCDLMVGIPMVGRVDSLNVAVAAGIMLYELLRQREKGRR
jgi:RNA methyltransferase, TrmH family